MPRAVAHFAAFTGIGALFGMVTPLIVQEA
jgi:hypothetical protein